MVCHLFSDALTLAFRPQKVVAAQRLFTPILGGVVSVYSEAENRVLNAEKAHLSTSDGLFSKTEYNILIPIELWQKVIAAQQLLDSKCRHLTASSGRPQFRCRRIETGFSGGEYNSLTARKTQGKSIVAQALFHRYCSTSQPLPMLLTPTTNVIKYRKAKCRRPPSHRLDKRLHFPFLKKGAVPSATNYPPIYNCTLIISYRTGGNNQLGPQKEAHQQFRYSATRNRAHCPVHPPRHSRLLRKRRRSAGVPGVAGSARSGKDGRKGR